MVHFRKKKKEILDQILGPHRYDRDIRPAGHVNDTSGFLLNLVSMHPIMFVEYFAKHT